MVIMLWLVCCTTFPCRQCCYTVFTVRGWLFLLYQLSFCSTYSKFVIVSCVIFVLHSCVVILSVPVVCMVHLFFVLYLTVYCCPCWACPIGSCLLVWGGGEGSVIVPQLVRCQWGGWGGVIVLLRNTSNYAKHALDHQHPFGPIQETMQILQYQKKGTHLNTIERFFIFKDYLINNHPNDEFNINTNKFFEAILKT